MGSSDSTELSEEEKLAYLELVAEWGFNPLSPTNRRVFFEGCRPFSCF